jgi:hypothetical protein
MRKAKAVSQGFFLFVWLVWFGFCLFVCLFVFAALGFELRAYTLSHSTSPFFCEGFF